VINAALSQPNWLAACRYRGSGEVIKIFQIHASARGLWRQRVSGHYS